ncbi:alpha/beta hydrolase family protein [Larkinella sp.]|uniref:alpha/beta hydrolase family protein n=1 Tax=Larkinella sp. TaxID=2034517 RepID=UPI003BAD91AC
MKRPYKADRPSRSVQAGTIWKQLLVFCSLGLLLPGRAVAQKEYNVLQNWFLLRSDDNALFRHLLRQSTDLLEKRTATVARINTLNDWKKRQQWARQTLQDAIGPFPERTPLHAKTVRVLPKKGYRVEHLIYESQPGFYVPATLFVPEPLTGKAPGIVYCSGHSPTGYKAHSYQQVLLNLVQKGFVVLAFEAVGQGERLEYLDPKKGKSLVGQPTREHDVPGVQTFITGSCQARYMMWDGIRALDYLLTRPEVDPARIGMTGRSGGGTQTAFIGALDDRILATAPECYITNFTRLLQALGPPDAEQNLPNIIGRAFDEPDFLLARAPKPTLMITTLNDYFNHQGSLDTHAEVSRIYQAYDKPENFGMAEDIAGHASTRKNREAMYAFFQKTLANPGNAQEDSVAYLTDEEMQVTPTGQLSTSQKTETVFSLNARQADKLLVDLQTARKNPHVHLPKVVQQAKKLSGYLAPNLADKPVYAGVIPRKGFQIEKYFIKGEGDYVIPYLLYVPAKPNGKAVIYVSPKGKASLTSNEEVLTLVNGGCHVLLPDLIGTGETGPGQWAGGTYFQHVKMDGLGYDLWYGSVLIGRSLVGLRAGDVVKLVQLLKKKGATDVGGIAVRELSPVLLHAAAFEPALGRVALLNPYGSYHAITTQRDYNLDFIEGTVSSALTAYDLPDLAASLAPRKLLMTNVTDGKDTRQTQDVLQKELSFVTSTYQQAGVSQAFYLLASDTDSPTLNDFFADWVK